MCDEMANSLVGGKSLLKATDYRLKGKDFSHKICNNCDLGITGNVQHVIFECSGETFLKMFHECYRAHWDE